MSDKKETALEFFELGKLYQNKFDESVFMVLEPAKPSSYYGYTVFEIKILTKDSVKTKEIGDKSLLFANPKSYCKKIE